MLQLSYKYFLINHTFVKQKLNLMKEDFGCRNYQFWFLFQTLILRQWIHQLLRKRTYTLNRCYKLMRNTRLQKLKLLVLASNFLKLLLHRHISDAKNFTFLVVENNALKVNLNLFFLLRLLCFNLLIWCIYQFGFKGFLYMWVALHQLL